MATGVLSCDLTFTFINPVQLPLLNPRQVTLSLPWVDHVQPLRAFPLPAGTEATGFGNSRRKGIGEIPTPGLDRGAVLIHLNDALGIRAYLDIKTAVIFLMADSWPDSDDFCSCLADLSEQVNGPNGEIDLP